MFKRRKTSNSERSLRFLAMAALWPLLGACGKARQSSTVAPSVIKVERTARGFHLLRNGEPYFIQGAGGDGPLDTLKAAGGNSIRTWGTDELESQLAAAHALGLTVTAGIWLSHERHGFSYGSAGAVAKQLQSARADVLNYKDHPALLLWGIGNEMEGRGDNPAVWKAVNDIAKMIKTTDPNHPTMTVIADVDPTKIKGLNTFCPDIDILGINSYGGLVTLPQRLQQFGWKRPYIVTEFGPIGPWETGKTPWGAAIEWSSTQKADFYVTGYQKSIASQRHWCLGSYAFLWGYKQEHTGTWFGMLLPTGDKLGAVDAMTYNWTGKWPSNLAPRIVELSSAASFSSVAPATRMTADVVAYDVDNNPLTVYWEVRSESTDKKQGGDVEQEPPAHFDRISKVQGTHLIFQTPQQPGAYRLFVYVFDGQGHAATANVPFWVAAAE
ncbi:MAG: hypothetical protein M3347_02320 [Armatimonadota bacterium]|nr:hypothetical protein [Armatimonadota bacterium]